MQINPLFLALITLFAAAPAAGTQSGSAPVAQVPGLVTSAPATPFGPPSSPGPQPAPLSPTLSAPTYAPTQPTTSPSPTLPSIEAMPIPVQRGAPISAAPAPQDAARSPDAATPEGSLGLPKPLQRPLDQSSESDPVLALGRSSGPIDGFRAAIAAAVDRNPSLGEAEAAAREAQAVRREARAGLFPTADINVTSYSTVSRAFSNDIDNIIERSRPRSRTDAQLSLNQTLFDFGASFSRIAAGGNRIRAAAATIDDTASQIALRTIAAWYDIYTYRSLLEIGRRYLDNQAARRSDFNQRIAQGANAQVDISRLDSSLATIGTRLARFERAAANAEAQFAQLAGRPAPAQLDRAPFLGTLPAGVDEARAAAVNVPAVLGAGEQARAARNDARAAKREYLPYISAGVDAGRYGVFENERDYDVRARISLRQRIGGAFDARIDQAEARADGAAARATRTAEEAARDAAIAWSDLQALNRQTVALERNYMAARQSRDAIEARFRVSRGSLFDVIDANDAYFGAAAAYIESLADRDAAHYVLLARTGGLLDALGIDSAYQQARR